MQHLLGIENLTRNEIEHILDTAKGFQEISKRTIKKVPSLKGRTVLTVFYENSTRTRISFEIAAKRLSADTVNMSASGSSVSKGESLLDTAQTLDAMQADAIVIRHAQSGAPHFIAPHVKAHVINAGDGQHEHPTQALLDLLTIRERFESFEKLNVAIVGDVLHSRVARSNLLALKKMGANVRLFGPKTLLPKNVVEAYGCEIADTLKDCLEGAHVAMALRLQRERMGAGFIPSLKEYAIEFGINAQALNTMHPQGILLHPGPVNRGVELSPDVVDGPRSVILAQVENGVAVRAAVLYLILAGD